ncbi:Vesicle coat complex COPI, beta subunit [Trachipleistophora hominis]|uniref:Vesicle coat complex COPI, beta subunit n=1 Tax=Trachipleistophora hominis TaxID=72359 RepID=L7JRJ0_TRAHO|nr:Vesicle coat complex COPI, beta subunit [Trachipleistophora hominis]
MHPLIITAEPPIPKEKILSHLTSPKTSKKADALRAMITLLSQNADLSEYTTTAIREVCQCDDTQLKKIFYLFLEMIPKCDREGNMLAEILLIANQVRKDLEHPNEYVRGKVLHFVCTLMYGDVIELMFGPIVHNLEHLHYYVRRNALLCVTKIYEHFGANFPDIPDRIRRCMAKETNPYCLRQCYASLRVFERVTGTRLENGALVNEIVNMPFKNVPEELLGVVLCDAPSEELLWACVDSNKCKFQCALLLMQHRHSEDRAVRIILEMIRAEPSLKEIGLQCIKDVYYTRIQVNELLTLLDSNVMHIVFELVYRVAEIADYPIISEFVLSMIRQSHGDTPFLIFLIEQAIFISKNFNVHNAELNKTVQQFVLGEPEVAYVAINLLERDAHSHRYVLSVLHRIKYGRIFRRAVSVVASNNALAHDFLGKVDEMMAGNALSSTVYFGVACALALYKYYKERALSRKIVADKVLELIKRGRREECFDFSSHEIMASVLGDVLSDDEAVKENVDKNGKASGADSITAHSTGKDSVTGAITGKNDQANTGVNENAVHHVMTTERTQNVVKNTNRDVLDALSLKFLKSKRADDTDEQIRAFLCPTNADREENSCQMTGYSDHLYVEAAFRVSRLSVNIDLLVVNQTNKVIQNILFDFTTSCNIAHNFTCLPLSLGARSIIRMPFSFTIKEVFNGFITGCVSYTIKNVAHVLNMSTLSFRVNEFLQSRVLENEEFKTQWLGLEWENTYTSRFRCTRPVVHIFRAIAESVKAYVVDVKTDDNTFLVANLVCTTFLGEDVLINLKIRRDEMIHLDCRMRSTEEALVKSLSVVFSELLRRMKE